ncbi:MAG: hypothetical protein HOO94_04395 [Novosphingobium sp.]|uniref:DUF6628 family protein n=1 Tax=Novosphingobium sp. TaxID=1874826 RepID=UPI0017C53FD8|nr:hypothetical protein [Novosphingobium sp.]
MSSLNAPSMDLPLAVPNDPDLALVLALLRRMAARDLFEPEIAEIAHQGFGHNFERPLTLLRAYLIETASASTRQIRMAPGATGRMTSDEGQMLTILSAAAHHPGQVSGMLQELCASSDVAAPQAIVGLLASVLTGAGCPLTPAGYAVN